jgi:hypothetical protein
MHSRPVYLLHVALAVLLLSAAAPAMALDFVINNGLAPPNPTNVINDGTYAAGGSALYVRNVGCGGTDPSETPCASPGAPTTVALETGAIVETLYARDTSIILMTEGDIPGFFVAFDAATIFMSGGFPSAGATARGEASIFISGGTLDQVVARDASVIEISGSGFRIDGTPVGFGEISVTSGDLTGTLAAGNSMRAYVVRDPGAIIRLVPEPATGSLLALGLVGIAAVGRKRAH